MLKIFSYDLASHWFVDSSVIYGLTLKGESKLRWPPLGCHIVNIFQGCACLNVSHLELSKDFHNIFTYGYKWANRSNWCPFRWLHFGECSWNILGKNLQKSLLKFLCTILLRFVLKICQKYVIFKVFQIHLHYFWRSKCWRNNFIFWTFIKWDIIFDNVKKKFKLF
jgi:hypothetical protein